MIRTATALKIKWLNATCRLVFWDFVLDRSPIIVVEIADPILAPITIPRAMSREISWPWSAVSVITIVHALVWIAVVTNIPMRTNPQIESVAYSPREIDWASVSTLVFIYSRPKNNSQNPAKKRPKYANRECHPIRTKNAPIPINIKAKDPISILNHNKAIIQGTRVVPRFAPNNTPSAFERPIIPAQTNPKVIIVTTVLLWIIHVSTSPVTILFSRVLVFFSRTLLSVFFPRDLIVSSKTIIPKRNIPSPPIKSP